MRVRSLLSCDRCTVTAPPPQALECDERNAQRSACRRDRPARRVHHRVRPGIRFLSLFTLGLLGIGHADARTTRAQPASDLVDAAREHGKAGLAALADHDNAGAERKLSEALRLHDAPTLYLARARARRNLGQLLAAAADLSAAIAHRVQANEHPAFRQARLEARQELAELEARIPRLTLEAGAQPLRVQIDGATWPPPVVNIARALDPGEHEIQVTWKSGEPERHVVRLDEGSTRTLKLRSPPRSEFVRRATPSQVFQANDVVSAAPAPSAAGGGKPLAAYLLAAASIGLAGGAIATGVVARDRSDEFDRNNRTDVSMVRKERLRADANRWAWINTGLWAGAAVTAGVAVYLFLSADGPGASVHANVTPGALQVSMTLGM